MSARRSRRIRLHERHRQWELELVPDLEDEEDEVLRGLDRLRRGVVNRVSTIFKATGAQLEALAQNQLRPIPDAWSVLGARDRLLTPWFPQLMLAMPVVATTMVGAGDSHGPALRLTGLTTASFGPDTSLIFVFMPMSGFFTLPDTGITLSDLTSKVFVPATEEQQETLEALEEAVMERRVEGETADSTQRERQTATRSRISAQRARATVRRVEETAATMETTAGRTRDNAQTTRENARRTRETAGRARTTDGMMQNTAEVLEDVAGMMENTAGMMEESAEMMEETAVRMRETVVTRLTMEAPERTLDLAVKKRKRSFERLREAGGQLGIEEKEKVLEKLEQHYYEAEQSLQIEREELAEFEASLEAMEVRQYTREQEQDERQKAMDNKEEGLKVKEDELGVREERMRVKEEDLRVQEEEMTRASERLAAMEEQQNEKEQALEKKAQEQQAQEEQQQERDTELQAKATRLHDKEEQLCQQQKEQEEIEQRQREVEELQDEREQKLYKDEKVLEERSQQMDEREETLDCKQQGLEQKESEQAEREQHLNEEKAILGEKQKQNRQHEEELSQREETLANDREMVTQREQKTQEEEQRLQEWDQQNEEREETLKQNEALLEEHLAKLAEEKERLDARDTVLNVLEASLNEMTAKLDEKETEMNEREKEQKEEQVRLMKKSEELTEKEETLWEKEETLQEKEEMLQEKEETLRQKEETLQEKEEMLREKEEMLREKEETLGETEEMLREKEEMLGKKEETLQEKEQKLTEKENALNQKEENLTQMKTRLEEEEVLIRRREKAVEETEEKQSEWEARNREEEQRLNVRAQELAEGEELHRQREIRSREDQEMLAERKRALQELEEMLRDWEKRSQEEEEKLKAEECRVQLEEERLHEREQRIEQEEERQREWKQKLEMEDRRQSDEAVRLAEEEKRQQDSRSRLQREEGRQQREKEMGKDAKAKDQKESQSSSRAIKARKKDEDWEVCKSNSRFEIRPVMETVDQKVKKQCEESRQAHEVLVVNRGVGTDTVRGPDHPAHRRARSLSPKARARSSSPRGVHCSSLTSILTEDDVLMVSSYKGQDQTTIVETYDIKYLREQIFDTAWESVSTHGITKPGKGVRSSYQSESFVLSAAETGRGSASSRTSSSSRSRSRSSQRGGNSSSSTQSPDSNASHQFLSNARNTAIHILDSAKANSAMKAYDEFDHIPEKIISFVEEGSDQSHSRSPSLRQRCSSPSITFSKESQGAVSDSLQEALVEKDGAKTGASKDLMLQTDGDTYFQTAEAEPPQQAKKPLSHEKAFLSEKGLGLKCPDQSLETTAVIRYLAPLTEQQENILEEEENPENQERTSTTKRPGKILEKDCRKDIFSLERTDPTSTSEEEKSSETSSSQDISIDCVSPEMAMLLPNWLDTISDERSNDIMIDITTDRVKQASPPSHLRPGVLQQERLSPCAAAQDEARKAQDSQSSVGKMAEHKGRASPLRDSDASPSLSTQSPVKEAARDKQSERPVKVTMSPTEALVLFPRSQGVSPVADDKCLRTSVDQSSLLRSETPPEINSYCQRSHGDLQLSDTSPRFRMAPGSPPMQQRSIPLERFLQQVSQSSLPTTSPIQSHASAVRSKTRSPYSVGIRDKGTPPVLPAVSLHKRTRKSMALSEPSSTKTSPVGSPMRTETVRLISGATSPHPENESLNPILSPILQRKPSSDSKSHSPLFIRSPVKPQFESSPESMAEVTPPHPSKLSQVSQLVPSFQSPHSHEQHRSSLPLSPPNGGIPPLLTKLVHSLEKVQLGSIQTLVTNLSRMSSPTESQGMSPTNIQALSHLASPSKAASPISHISRSESVSPFQGEWQLGAIEAGPETRVSPHAYSEKNDSPTSQSSRQESASSRYHTLTDYDLSTKHGTSHAVSKKTSSPRPRSSSPESLPQMERKHVSQFQGERNVVMHYPGTETKVYPRAVPENTVSPRSQSSRPESVSPLSDYDPRTKHKTSHADSEKTVSLRSQSTTPESVSPGKRMIVDHDPGNEHCISPRAVSERIIIPRLHSSKPESVFPGEHNIADLHRGTEQGTRCFASERVTSQKSLYSKPEAVSPGERTLVNTGLSTKQGAYSRALHQNTASPILRSARLESVSPRQGEHTLVDFDLGTEHLTSHAVSEKSSSPRSQSYRPESVSPRERTLADFDPGTEHGTSHAVFGKSISPRSQSSTLESISTFKREHNLADLEPGAKHRMSPRAVSDRTASPRPQFPKAESAAPLQGESTLELDTGAKDKAPHCADCAKSVSPKQASSRSSLLSVSPRMGSSPGRQWRPDNSPLMRLKPSPPKSLFSDKGQAICRSPSVASERSISSRPSSHYKQRTPKQHSSKGSVRTESPKSLKREMCSAQLSPPKSPCSPASKSRQSILQRHACSSRSPLPVSKTPSSSVASDTPRSSPSLGLSTPSLPLSPKSPRSSPEKVTSPLASPAMSSRALAQTSSVRKPRSAESSTRTRLYPEQAKSRRPSHRPELSEASLETVFPLADGKSNSQARSSMTKLPVPLAPQIYVYPMAHTEHKGLSTQVVQNVSEPSIKRKADKPGSKDRHSHGINLPQSSDDGSKSRLRDLVAHFEQVSRQLAPQASGRAVLSSLGQSAERRTAGALHCESNTTKKPTSPAFSPPRNLQESSPMPPSERAETPSKVADFVLHSHAQAPISPLRTRSRDSSPSPNWLPQEDQQMLLKTLQKVSPSPLYSSPNSITPASSYHGLSPGPAASLARQCSPTQGTSPSNVLSTRRRKPDTPRPVLPVQTALAKAILPLSTAAVSPWAQVKEKSISESPGTEQALPEVGASLKVCSESPPASLSSLPTATSSRHASALISFPSKESTGLSSLKNKHRGPHSMSSSRSFLTSALKITGTGGLRDILAKQRKASQDRESRTQPTRVGQEVRTQTTELSPLKLEQHNARFPQEHVTTSLCERRVDREGQPPSSIVTITQKKVTYSKERMPEDASPVFGSPPRISSVPVPASGLLHQPKAQSAGRVHAAKRIQRTGTSPQHPPLLVVTGTAKPQQLPAHRVSASAGPAREVKVSPAKRLLSDTYGVRSSNPPHPSLPMLGFMRNLLNTQHRGEPQIKASKHARAQTSPARAINERDPGISSPSQPPEHKSPALFTMLSDTWEHRMQNQYVYDAEKKGRESKTRHTGVSAVNILIGGHDVNSKPKHKTAKMEEREALLIQRAQAKKLAEKRISTGKKIVGVDGDSDASDISDVVPEYQHERRRKRTSQEKHQLAKKADNRSAVLDRQPTSTPTSPPVKRRALDAYEKLESMTSIQDRGLQASSPNTCNSSPIKRPKKYEQSRFVAYPTGPPMRRSPGALRDQSTVTLRGSEFPVAGQSQPPVSQGERAFPLPYAASLDRQAVPINFSQQMHTYRHQQGVVGDSVEMVQDLMRPGGSTQLHFGHQSPPQGDAREKRRKQGRRVSWNDNQSSSMVKMLLRKQQAALNSQEHGESQSSNSRPTHDCSQRKTDDLHGGKPVNVPSLDSQSSQISRRCTVAKTTEQTAGKSLLPTSADKTRQCAQSPQMVLSRFPNRLQEDSPRHSQETAEPRYLVSQSFTDHSEFKRDFIPGNEGREGQFPTSLQFSREQMKSKEYRPVGDSPASYAKEEETCRREFTSTSNPDAINMAQKQSLHRSYTVHSQHRKAVVTEERQQSREYIIKKNPRTARFPENVGHREGKAHRAESANTQKDIIPSRLPRAAQSNETQPGPHRERPADVNQHAAWSPQVDHLYISNNNLSLCDELRNADFPPADTGGPLKPVSVDRKCVDMGADYSTEVQHWINDMPVDPHYYPLAGSRNHVYDVNESANTSALAGHDGDSSSSPEDRVFFTPQVEGEVDMWAGVPTLRPLQSTSVNTANYTPPLLEDDSYSYVYETAAHPGYNCSSPYFSPACAETDPFYAEEDLSYCLPLPFHRNQHKRYRQGNTNNSGDDHPKLASQPNRSGGRDEEEPVVYNTLEAGASGGGDQGEAVDPKPTEDTLTGADREQARNKNIVLRRRRSFGRTYMSRLLCQRSYDPQGYSEDSRDCVLVGRSSLAECRQQECEPECLVEDADICQYQNSLLHPRDCGAEAQCFQYREGLNYNIQHVIEDGCFVSDAEHCQCHQDLAHHRECMSGAECMMGDVDARQYFASLAHDNNELVAECCPCHEEDNHTVDPCSVCSCQDPQQQFCLCQEQLAASCQHTPYEGNDDDNDLEYEDEDVEDGCQARCEGCGCSVDFSSALTLEDQRLIPRAVTQIWQSPVHYEQDDDPDCMALEGQPNMDTQFVSCQTGETGRRVGGSLPLAFTQTCRSAHSYCAGRGEGDMLPSFTKPEHNYNMSRCQREERHPRATYVVTHSPHYEETAEYTGKNEGKEQKDRRRPRSEEKEKCIVAEEVEEGASKKHTYHGHQEEDPSVHSNSSSTHSQESKPEGAEASSTKESQYSSITESMVQAYGYNPLTQSPFTARGYPPLPEHRSSLDHISLPFVKRKAVVFLRNDQEEFVEVGRGTYGCVYLAQATTRRGTAKVVVKDFFTDSSSWDLIVHEARMLCYLEDTGVIPHFYGLLKRRSHSDDFSLIQQYFAQGRTLHTVLVSKEQLTPELWQDVAWQLAHGLLLIHEKHVLLNDLKGDNVLIDMRRERKVIKYIDLGMATYRKGLNFHLPEDQMSKFNFLSPEVRAGAYTSPMSDVYSLGYLLEQINRLVHLPLLCDVSAHCMDDLPVDRPHLPDIVHMLMPDTSHHLPPAGASGSYLLL